MTSPYDDVIHPVCCAPNASFHLSVILCAALNVSFRIRANPYCMDRYVSVYGQEFVDVVIGLQVALSDDERNELKGALKNTYTPRGVFNNSFATPRMLFDVFNKTPAIKRAATELAHRMYRDACGKYPEFENALWESHKSVFERMTHVHEGDHYCFNPVCASCIPAVDGITAHMPLNTADNRQSQPTSPAAFGVVVHPPRADPPADNFQSPSVDVVIAPEPPVAPEVFVISSSPSDNTGITVQDSVNVSAVHNFQTPAQLSPNDTKKAVFDLFMNNLDNPVINWKHIEQALTMNGAV